MVQAGKRFAAGEQIGGWPVDTWNRMVDVIEQAPPGFQWLPNIASILPRTFHHSAVLRVRNKTGGSLTKGALLGIDDTAFDASVAANMPAIFAQEPVVDGVAPVTADHTEALLVLLEPIGNNRLGRAALGGVVWAWVNITDTSHTHARIKDSDADKFESGTYGAKILKQESGTGTKRALINLSSYAPQPRYAVASTTITAGSGTTTLTPGSGSATLRNHNGSDQLVSTGETITVKNPFSEIASGTHLVVYPFMPKWIWQPIAVKCE